jgi:ABC-type uncharacterized transport system substrate-binding protein
MNMNAKRYLFTLILVFAASAVFGHPHMFIDSRITFELTDEELKGFWIEWGFDEVFTAMITHDYDRDGNGSFSESEQEAIRKGAFSNLKNHRYFTYILTDGERIQPETVESFSAWLDGHRLFYRFFVPYRMPVDEEANSLRVAIYDKSFYCDIATFDTDPVTAKAPDGIRTSFSVQKNKDLEITYSPKGGRRRSGETYTGVAYPDQVKLTFRSSGSSLTQNSTDDS